MNKLVIDEYTEEQLDLARKTYGNKNQILVCMEELNELACALAKYPRYDDEHKATVELYDKVLDEVADVTIILSHVKSIFDITDEALDARISKKVIRLSRWLLHNESMQETIDDRKIDETVSPCKTCKHKEEEPDVRHSNWCDMCLRAQATEGKAPFYIETEE